MPTEIINKYILTKYQIIRHKQGEKIPPELKVKKYYTGIYDKQAPELIFSTSKNDSKALQSLDEAFEVYTNLLEESLSMGVFDGKKEYIVIERWDWK